MKYETSREKLATELTRVVAEIMSLQITPEVADLRERIQS